MVNAPSALVTAATPVPSMVTTVPVLSPALARTSVPPTPPRLTESVASGSASCCPAASASPVCAAPTKPAFARSTR